MLFSCPVNTRSRGSVTDIPENVFRRGIKCELVEKDKKCEVFAFGGIDLLEVTVVFLLSSGQ